MGVIKAHEENPDGTYRVVLDEVTGAELDYLFSLLNNIALAEKAEAEKAGSEDPNAEEDEIFERGVGETIVIPNGDYEGMVINDIYNERGGVKALADLLTRDPNFCSDVKKDWQKPDYSIGLLLCLLKDLYGFISANIDEEHPFRVCQAFEQYMGIDSEEIRKMEPNEAKAFCLRKKDEFLLKLNQALRDCDDELKIITEGDVGKVYVDEGLKGISRLLRSKSSTPEDTYAEVMKCARVLLKYCESIVPFEEWYEAFAPFFPKEIIDPGKLEDSEKAAKYHELLTQLIKRMG